jgi:hypothetical protein
MSEGLHVPFDEFPSEASTGKSNGKASDWPELTEIEFELQPVEKFDLRLLPSSFRPLVEDISERMQVPYDFAATGMVVTLAGCVSRRAVVRPKKDDYSWEVIPNLWGAVIAPPGFMKSPVLTSVTRPLVKVEAEWAKQYRDQSSEWELKQEQKEIAHQSWKEEYKRSLKKGAGVPLADTDNVGKEDKPRQPRLVTTDATYEKLHEIMQDNPAGVLVIRDELTGWLADLEKRGRESERSFYLQAWNGDAPFTIDRIGRDSIYVPAACVSVIGNIQPARLRSYLSDAIFDGPGNDGLFQRFQLLVWPDCNPDWTLIDRPPNSKVFALAEKTIRALVALSEDTPVRMRFDAVAQLMFYEWWTELEPTVLGAQDVMHPAMIAHLAKYRSLMPTLAALFELTARIDSSVGVGSEVVISLDRARQAGAYCEYLKSHANRVYGCLVSPEVGAAQELSRHIRARHLPDLFTTRDVYRKHWRGLDVPEKTQGALALLGDAGWIRRLDLADGFGRPSDIWVINPEVYARGN